MYKRQDPSNGAEELTEVADLAGRPIRIVDDMTDLEAVIHNAIKVGGGFAR